MTATLSLSVSLRDALSRVKTEVNKKLGRGHAADELRAALVARERLFRSPPFTPEFAAAARRITPQFHLAADEASREIWELSQNGSSWGELEVLEPILRRLSEPRRVLEIGPGLGRSAVFFKKRLGWQQVPFDLYEGEGEATKYTADGPRFEDSFCGDFAALQAALEFNGIEAATIEDAAAHGYRLSDLPGPYDLVYSFYAVGYHWSLEHFLDEILELMTPTALGIFTIHKKFREFVGLERVAHRLVTYRRVVPKHRTSRLLLVSPDAVMLDRLAAGAAE